MPSKKAIVSGSRRIITTSPSPVIKGKKREDDGLLGKARSRNFSIPGELIEATASGKLVLFIGAGVSKLENASLFPTWPELIKGLLSEAKKYPELSLLQSKEIASLIKSGDLLMAAEILKSKIPINAYNSYLRRQFEPAGKLSLRFHQQLFRLKPAAVLTTNFDRLLEEAQVAVGVNPAKYTYKEVTEAQHRISQWTTNKPPVILKLHGCITDPSNVILSEYDYRRVLHRNPGYRTLLSSIFANYTVLILGYSLSDKEINLTLESLQDSFDYRKKTDYIFLSAKGKNLFEDRRLSENFGVQPIWYNPVRNHKEVISFVSQLQKAIV